MTCFGMLRHFMKRQRQAMLEYTIFDQSGPKAICMFIICLSVASFNFAHGEFLEIGTDTILEYRNYSLHRLETLLNYFRTPRAVNNTTCSMIHIIWSSLSLSLSFCLCVCVCV